MIRELANGRAVDLQGSHLRLPWSRGSELDIYVAAYGPKALALTGEVADGFILQLADLAIAEWSIAAVRRAAEQAGRDPMSVKICVAAPAYVGDDLAHQRDQVRWFGGMVGNHVADIVERYGADGAAVPQALTDYIAGRQGYDYNEHGRAGNTHADFVPDEIVDRFCVLGPAEAHIERLLALRSSASTSSRSTCSTTPRTRPWRRTPRRSCRRCRSTGSRSRSRDRTHERPPACEREGVLRAVGG